MWLGWWAERQKMGMMRQWQHRPKCKPCIWIGWGQLVMVSKLIKRMPKSTICIFARCTWNLAYQQINVTSVSHKKIMFFFFTIFFNFSVFLNYLLIYFQFCDVATQRCSSTRGISQVSLHSKEKMVKKTLQIFLYFGTHGLKYHKFRPLSSKYGNIGVFFPQ